MIKRLLTTISCAFFLLALPAGLVWKEATVGGGGGQSFADDFTSLANFEQIAALSVWTASGGLAIAAGTNFTAHSMVYTTDTDTADQWCLIHYENVATTAESQYQAHENIGCIFRASDNGDSTWDFVYTAWDNDHDRAKLSMFDNDVNNTWSVTDSACFTTAGGDLDDPSWLGSTITGTDAATVVNIWIFTSDPGTDSTTWGTADCTIASGTKSVYPTGKGVGTIGSGRATTSTPYQVRMYEWEGGDL